MANHDIAKLNIMVVDDSSTMLAIPETNLTSRGATRVRRCDDGVEAFEAFRRAPSDIVVTDRVMRTQSGHTLVNLLRDPKKNPHPSVPILMVTAKAAQDDILRVRGSGADAYLAKPVPPETVYQRILQVIQSPIAANDDIGLIYPAPPEKEGTTKGNNQR